MTKGSRYQVKALARITGVSVRTLHHYDAIGLLPPSERTAAGYRLYSDDDLLRLQQILIQRELGLPLDAIKRALDDPSFDRRAALEQQRTALAERAQHTAAMLRAIDTALAALPRKGDRTMKEMTSEERSALFDGFDPARYEAEADARWGGTEAYAESKRRTARYSKADWSRHKAEADAIMRDAAELFRTGVAADSEEAMRVAERHRDLIDRWFYPCSPQMHAALAATYTADARFAENIDKYADGLTAWWAEAICASSRAHG